MQSAHFQGGHLRLVSPIRSVTEVCVFCDCGVEQWAERQVGMKITKSFVHFSSLRIYETGRINNYEGLC